jgi:hypothetical protein
MKGDQYEKEWAHTKIDTLFYLTLNEWNNLAAEFQKLNAQELLESPITRGMDGTVCRLTLGMSYAQNCSFTFWSPDYDTKARHLTQYLKCCKAVIRVGGFKPKDIL